MLGQNDSHPSISLSDFSPSATFGDIDASLHAPNADTTNAQCSINPHHPLNLYHTQQSPDERRDQSQSQTTVSHGLSQPFFPTISVSDIDISGFSYNQQSLPDPISLYTPSMAQGLHFNQSDFTNFVPVAEVVNPAEPLPFIPATIRSSAAVANTTPSPSLLAEPMKVLIDVLDGPISPISMVNQAENDSTSVDTGVAFETSPSFSTEYLSYLNGFVPTVSTRMFEDPQTTLLYHKLPWFRDNNEKEARELVDLYFQNDDQLVIPFVHRGWVKKHFHQISAILM
jgi:hypothetical protein